MSAAFLFDGATRYSRCSIQAGGSEGKLRLVREWFDQANKALFDPVPVKRLDGRIIMTDGHTRAVAAYLARWDTIPVYWDNDDLDMRAYVIDMKWCG